MAELVNLPLVDQSVDLVERLEQLLALAKTGELSAMAYAVVYRNGNTGDGWTRLSNKQMMVGAVGIMHHRLCAAFAD